MKAPPKPPRAVVLAVVSDVHAGGTTALCPPRIALDDGGAYEASKAQQWLWQCWTAYWQRVAIVRDALNAELYIVFNGDLVDGDHHNTSQILSRNPNAQAAVLTAAMAVPLTLNAERLFFVRGTEAHVGGSASAEERIADGLRRDKRPVVIDPESGTSSWWHLRMDVHGVRLDIAHHGRTGQREHTRASAASLHAHDILLSHVKAGDRYPDLCFRAHYHRFNDSHDAAPVRVVTTGAWQLATSYVHAKCTDTLADIGGAIAVVTPGGPVGSRYTIEKVHFQAARGPVWQAT